jgi:hypothetical protein
MKISWGAIVTGIVITTVSSLVVLIIGGAGAIVWKEATSVNDKVDNATQGYRDQQAYMEKAVETLQAELIELRKQNNELIAAIEDVRRVVDPEWEKSGKVGFPKARPVPKEDYIQQMLPQLRPPKAME